MERDTPATDGRRRQHVERRAALGALALVAAPAIGASLGIGSPTTAAAQGRPGAAQPSDPITAARFSLVIDGYDIAAFSEFVGMTSGVEPVDYMASSDREVVVSKLPGKVKPASVVLKRAQSSAMELWAWHEAVMNGDIVAARKSCSLVMYNAEGKPVARYHLENAWPSKLEIGTLKAGSSEALFETVTIIAERIQRVAA